MLSIPQPIDECFPDVVPHPTQQNHCRSGCPSPSPSSCGSEEIHQGHRIACATWWRYDPYSFVCARQVTNHPNAKMLVESSSPLLSSMAMSRETSSVWNLESCYHPSSSHACSPGYADPCSGAFRSQTATSSCGATPPRPSSPLFAFGGSERETCDRPSSVESIFLLTPPQAPTIPLGLSNGHSRHSLSPPPFSLEHADAPQNMPRQKINENCYQPTISAPAVSGSSNVKYALVQFKFTSAYFVAPFRVAVGDMVVANDSHVGMVKDITTEFPFASTLGCHDASPPKLVRHARAADRSRQQELNISTEPRMLHALIDDVHRCAPSAARCLRPRDVELSLDQQSVIVHVALPPPSFGPSMEIVNRFTPSEIELFQQRFLTVLVQRCESEKTPVPRSCVVVVA